MDRRTILIYAVGLVGSSLACGQSQDRPATPKKIVFIAGPKDHGGPGAHEYEKDLRLLRHCLETSPDVTGITTKLYVGRAPEDLSELRDAATIVIHSSGDRLKTETHALFPTYDPAVANPYSPEEAAYLEKLDGLMKRGVGLVVLHYSLIIENPRSREYFLDWIGGYHKGGFSQVKIDRSEAKPAAAGHPILNGVGPWTTDHEYYFNQYFRENDPRFVPLLTSPLPSSDPKPHVIAWAVTRAGGGRGFAFTGGHYHKNMYVEDYRRMLLNAIVWTAKLEVPKKGIRSTVSKK
jgi:type 1 glutamine amidotransferase